jgi:uncharacterized protein YwqG
MALLDASFAERIYGSSYLGYARGMGWFSKRGGSGGGDAHAPVLRALGPWLQLRRRPAWRPVTKKGVPGRSQIGGTPLLRRPEGWPICARCREGRELFLQLDSSDLPAGAPWVGGGVLQVFYCTRCDADIDGWAPFSQAHVARVVPAGELMPPPADLVGRGLPPSAITGWEAFEDLPQPAEHEELGLEIDYDFQKKTVAVRCPSIGVAIDGLDIDAKDEEGRELAEAISVAAGGDKLGGWPHWIQGVEYPTCPRCATRMTAVFQLDSEDNLDFMFGDSGVAHVTQCPQHPDVVAFAWACC